MTENAPNKARSPVRRLYAALVAFDSKEAIHEDLRMQHADYEGMTGDLEPRFCEWVYHRLEGRTLVVGLLGTVLRPAQARRLALKFGCDGRRLDGLAPELVLREALHALGVHEATTPKAVCDGIKELEQCRGTLDAVISGTCPASLEESLDRRPTPALELGRRGAERLLKILCFFLWDNGFADVIKRVVSEGLHDYRPKEVVEDWEKWLLNGDLGQFNYLLKATGQEIRVSGLRVPFLSGDREVWSEPAFQAMGALAGALQTAVHDAQTTGRFEPDPQRRLQMQFNAVDKVLSKITGVGAPIWRPRAIQFFRRIDDGYSIHHEGYDDHGTIVRFFESTERYQFHAPYLFVAATNPSAVDVSCSILRKEFTRSV